MIIQMSRALEDACREGDCERMRQLIKEEDREFTNAAGSTPLYLACVGQHPSLIQSLVSMGAQQTIQGKSLFARVCMEGYFQSAETLLDCVSYISLRELLAAKHWARFHGEEGFERLLDGRVDNSSPRAGRETWLGG